MGISLPNFFDSNVSPNLKKPEFKEMLCFELNIMTHLLDNGDSVHPSYVGFRQLNYTMRCALRLF